MLNCTKEKPRLSFGGVEIVYILGCVVNQLALWFTSEQQVFLALRPVCVSASNRDPWGYRAQRIDSNLKIEIRVES
jgi:hypothetical protein